MMEKQFYLVLVTIILIFGTFPSIAQKCQKPIEGKKTPVEKVKRSKSKNYKDWQNIKLDSFNFYAPNELNTIKMDCIEAGCYDFESSDLSLTIDINPAAGRPTFEKQYASYCENYAQIDGADAWIWYFEDKDKFKHAGVNFTFERGGDYRIGIYLLSEKKDIKKISERIFKSVKFKKRPKKK